MSFGSSGNGSFTQKQINYILNRQRSLPVIHSAHNVNRQQPIIALYHQQVLEYNANANVDVNNRYREGVPSSKAKHASIQLYRPPKVRTEVNGVDQSMASKSYGNGSNNNNSNGSSRHINEISSRQQYHKLNVHAKEFTMANLNANANTRTRHAGIKPSSHATKSNSNFLKNTGSEMSDNTRYPKIPDSFALQRAKSSGNMLLHGLKNHAKEGKEVKFLLAEETKERPSAAGTVPVSSSLKRSKSLNATDAYLSMENGAVAVFTELNLFPIEMQLPIKQAIKDPNEMSERNLMVLARLVIEQATKGSKIAIPAAKLSIAIIEKDKKGTYLDTLLNTCQLWYQERDKRLRSIPVLFPSFLTFLNEMYNKLKRSQLKLKLKFDDTPPSLILLMLISKCCQDCLLHSAKHTLHEVESLFFVLTSIGRDLETELPDSLRKLYDTIRDVFLKSNDSAQIKKTLLQLIELRAAHWQLPVSAIKYYYPNSGKLNE